MYLFDTNVVSELRKQERADAHVLAWARGVPLSQMHLSVVSLQEIEVGILLIERRDKKQGAKLRHWLMQSVLPAFTGRILNIDEAVAIHSAKLHVPDRRPDRDALIAATALVHGLIVATRNVTDYEPMGVKLINPWG